MNFHRADIKNNNHSLTGEQMLKPHNKPYVTLLLRGKERHSTLCSRKLKEEISYKFSA